MEASELKEARPVDTYKLLHPERLFWDVWLWGCGTISLLHCLQAENEHQWSGSIWSCLI